MVNTILKFTTAQGVTSADVTSTLPLVHPVKRDCAVTQK